MSNQTIITKFVNGATTGKNSTGSLFIDGDTIYSYGKHFPLARRNADGTFWVNSDKYSVTTSKQQSMVRGAIARSNGKFSA
jgi:hypothetical protein